MNRKRMDWEVIPIPFYSCYACKHIVFLDASRLSEMHYFIKGHWYCAKCAKENGFEQK